MINAEYGKPALVRFVNKLGDEDTSSGWTVRTSVRRTTRS